MENKHIKWSFIVGLLLFISSVCTVSAEDLKQEYQSCADDAANLKVFIKEKVEPLNSPNALDLVGIKNTIPSLKKYTERFSGKQCGNTYKFIGLIGKGKQHDFYAIGLKLETLANFCRNIVVSYKGYKNEDLKTVKTFLNKLTNNVSMEIDRRV